MHGTGNQPQAGSAAAPPALRDEIEARVRRECYAAILPGVEVGAVDDFFALGGDSVMLIRVVALAQQIFAVELDALAFFQRPILTVLVDEVLRSRAAAGDDEAMLAILDQLGEASDEEVARLLATG